MTDGDVEGFGTWSPHEEAAADSVTAFAAASLHDLLDSPGAPPAEGDPLPALWHWLAFLPRAPQRKLGPDGHPKTGDFLPPIVGARRMWAGGRLEFAAPLTVGKTVGRRSVVSSVTRKSGRSGELVFVEVTHELAAGIANQGSSAITERQDIVYRPWSGATPVAPVASAAPAEKAAKAADVAAVAPSPSEPEPAESVDDWPWQLILTPDPPLLFRFSALTYNAHRIHYDHPYATGEEGYPGLVVHGPLQAIALAELCRRFADDRRVTSFAFRAERPAFDGAPMTLLGREDPGGSVALVARDAKGNTTMTATATLETAV